MPSVLSASVTWFLAPHAAYREACSLKTRQRCRCVKRARGPPVVCLATRVWRLSGVLEDCASTLESVREKYGLLSMSACQSCFFSFDAVNLTTCSSDDTSVGVTILYLLWQRGVSSRADELVTMSVQELVVLSISGT